MIKGTLKYSILIATTAIVLSSCKKDDDFAGPGNSTNGKTTAVFNSSVTYGTMIDLDGNEYKTVTIGTQTWMAENLRTTVYNDGSAIPVVTDSSAWSNLTTGACCTYNNTTSEDTIATYGRLYNWYAVYTYKLAPKGWHVPSEADWLTLMDYVDGWAAIDKLKETGNTHWINTNTGSNETGFTALPGGKRYGLSDSTLFPGEGQNVTGGTYSSLGSAGFWWGAPEDYIHCANTRRIDMFLSHVDYDRQDGFSVRCVKD